MWIKTNIFYARIIILSNGFSLVTVGEERREDLILLEVPSN